VVCQFGLEDEMFARLHTFGKALASNGGKNRRKQNKINRYSMKKTFLH
jgi:hypothetical protein